MTIFHAILLSIVEGITEFLPISSTGHLILVGKLLSVPQTAFTKTFDIVIQLGAITSVIVLFWKRLLAAKRLNLAVMAGFIPTVFLGFVFYPIIKNVLLDNYLVVAVSLIVGGVILYFFEWSIYNHDIPRTSVEKISIRNAVAIGCIQSLSFIPGVSRTAATTIGGMMTGLTREAAVEFSFLLSIPTMVAASSYDLFINRELLTSSNIFLLGVGFSTSFLTAWITIKAFLSYIKRNTFVVFAIYRIIIGLLFITAMK